MIKESPKAPLPDVKQNPSWYGEFWLKYPLSQTLIPMHNGQLFKARSELCIILNRVAIELFGKEGVKVTQSSSKPVANFVRDFLAWQYSLPDPLRPKNIVFPSQFKLQ